MLHIMITRTYKDIQSHQEHNLDRCHILSGLTTNGQLWQATIRWGLTPKEVRGIFNYE